MKYLKSFIGIVISVVIIVLLTNPQWLGLAQSTTEGMGNLITEHFLIEGSGALTLAHLLTLILAIAVVWLVYTVVKLILTLIAQRNNRRATVCYLIIGFLKYVAVIVAVVWGLAILGVNATAVLAGVGILGLVLGFGAQSLIEDIITGLFIIFEHQYEIGDIIILGDFRGVVRSIGVRTTTIEDMGGNLKVVNNSDIRNFQNRSKNPSLAVCEVDVAYDTDIKRLEAAMAGAFPKMFEAHKDLYLSAPRYLGLEELGENGMHLKVAVNCKEANFFAAKRQLNRDLLILFEQNGVTFPLHQVVVHKAD